MTETRAKTLDELSGVQFQFLYEADALREGASDNQQQKIDQQQRQLQSQMRGGSPSAAMGQPQRSHHPAPNPPN